MQFKDLTARSLFNGVVGLMLSLAVHVGMHGVSAALMEWLAYGVFAAVAAVFLSRLMDRRQGEEGLLLDDLQGSELHRRMAVVIQAIPVALAALFLGSCFLVADPLRRSGWILIVLAVGVGRDIDSLLRWRAK